MSEDIPSLETQEDRHNKTKSYTNEKLDRITERVYGSMHFWTWYDRTEHYNQVATVPNTVRADFAIG